MPSQIPLILLSFTLRDAVKIRHSITISGNGDKYFHLLWDKSPPSGVISLKGYILGDDRALRKQHKIPVASKLGMQITPKRSAWDTGKALQLRLVKHLSYSQIGVLLNVSKQTVVKGLKPLLNLLENPEMVSAFRESEADLMDAVRLLAMQAMGEQLSDPKRRKKLDMLRLNNLYGTLFDKQRLVRGESTAIIHQLTAIISAAHKDVRPMTGKHIEVVSEPPSSDDDSRDDTQPSG